MRPSIGTRRRPTLSSGWAQRWYGVAALALGVTLGVLALVTLLAGTANAAAVPQTAVYSSDGGSTWSTSAPVPAGQTVLVREYYNNATAQANNGVSITASLNSGFSLVPGTTKVCLNPGTTNPTAPSTELACNTDPDQSGPIDEGVAWSGSSLTISPSAGLFGQSTAATSGVLVAGTKRYLNLEQCNYYGAVRDSSPYFIPRGSTPDLFFGAATGASNSAQPSVTCALGFIGYPYQPINSGVENIALLGHRYLNLEQCNYFGSAGDSTAYAVSRGSTPNALYGSGTAASNTTPSSPVCGPGGGGYPFQAINSGVQDVDLLGNRFLNLEQCNYYGTSRDSTPYVVSRGTTANPLYGTGTTASNGTLHAATCGPGAVAYRYQPLNSGVENIDLLDKTRGQGFVQFTESSAVHGTPMFESWPTAAGTSLLLVGGLALAVRRWRNAH